MGKKSRRKKPGAVHSNQPPAVLPASVATVDYSASGFILGRFRQPEDEFYGLTSDESERCLRASFSVAKLITDRDSPDYEEEYQTALEFIFLVVVPLKKTIGFEAALNVLRKWPRVRRYWRKARRRVCDYCGRRNELSEPRLWVCAGCGVARYCDEACQAGDFSHHAKCCPFLASRWEGVGPIPTQLLTMPGSSDDPAIVPSARARERLEAWITRPVPMSRFYK